jgi:hypothetical protein
VKPAGLAAAIAEELEKAKQKRKKAGWDASHCQNKREPAGVCLGALPRDAAKDEDEHGCDRSDAEGAKAGAEKLAGIWLHGHQWIDACMM